MDEEDTHEITQSLGKLFLLHMDFVAKIEQQ